MSLYQEHSFSRMCLMGLLQHLGAELGGLHSTGLDLEAIVSLKNSMYSNIQSLMFSNLF